MAYYILAQAEIIWGLLLLIQAAVI